MLLLLTSLISLGMSEISYSGTTLTISNEQDIAPTQVSQYKTAATLVVTCTGPVAVQNKAFSGFTSLATISFQGTDITIKLDSFEGCTAIKTISFDTNQLSVDSGAFASATLPTINYKGSSFESGCAKFVSSKIKAFNVDVTGECTFALEAAANSYVEQLNIKASNIHFVQDCFKNAKGIQLINLEASNEIDFGLSAFIGAEIKEVICHAGKMISVVQDSFKNVQNMETFNLTSNGSLTLGVSCLTGATINEVNIKAAKEVSINQGSLTKVANFDRLTVEAGDFITCGNEAAQNSTIHEMFLKSGSYISFVQDCFKNTPNLKNLTVVANDFITFSVYSFMNSNINEIDIYANGTLSFEQGCFQNCANLSSVTIHSASDVNFKTEAFLNSQIEELVVINNATSGVVYAADANTVSFASESFKNCNELTNVDINTKGNVNIKSNSFQDNKYLTKLNVHADGKATIESGAFAGCDALYDPTIESPDKDVAGDAFPNGSGDDGGKKSHGSSSHKDDDDGSQSSARTLGNVDINSVYLGTSPNIVFNLNFMASFFRKVRKAVGHVVPSPDLVHSAIWVSNDKVVSDESVGALFVYGRYFNKINSQAYMGRDGAKAYVMTFKQFKEKYPSIDPMKLNTKNNMKLIDFINKIQEIGHWGVKDYNWPTNNCQHFTAKLINILGATRSAPSSDDWVDLPKQVLNSLEDNEKN